MATQVSAKSSTPITQATSSAADLLASAMDEAGGGMESDAGDLTADASDSVDDSADGVDLEAVDETAGDDQTQVEADESTDDAEPADDAAAKPDVVEVDITDEQGKRKIELDLSDKELMIRNAQQAAGARKLWAGYKERGEQVKQRDAQIAKLTEDLKPYDQLEDAYAKQGIDGVVQLLEKKSLDQLVEERAAWQKKWAAMSPAERAAWQSQQDTERARRDAAAARADADKVRQSAAAEREAAQVERLEGWAHEQFNRFSFSGKLGDKTEELRLDRALWNHMQAELVAAEAAGTQMTRDAVKQIASDAAAAFRQFAKKTAEKSVKSAKEKQKARATEAAQTRMVKSDRAVKKVIESKGIDVSSATGIAQLMAASLSRGKKRK